MVIMYAKSGYYSPPTSSISLKKFVKINILLKYKFPNRCVLVTSQRQDGVYNCTGSEGNQSPCSQVRHDDYLASNPINGGIWSGAGRPCFSRGRLCSSKVAFKMAFSTVGRFLFVFFLCTVDNEWAVG
jgi:hypothetical protein